MSEKEPTLVRRRLPKHVAIIMDGNGRWAKKNGVTRTRGHEEGARSVRVVVEACRELKGIKTLTLYAFSTENWRRSKREVDTLFRLLSRHIHMEIENLHREGIRVVFMGRKGALSQKVQADIARSEEMTAGNKEMLLNVAVNYGARMELVDACKTIAGKVKSGALHEDDIDEDCLSEHLYIPEVKDVDLLIRTSGEMRLSNFMLWQISYAEIVVTPTFWPAFRKRNLHRVLLEYQARKRRFGGRK